MSTANSDSSMEINLEPMPLGEPGPLGGEVAENRVEATEPAIWLNGDVLSCACPECGAPMSIRLWLMLADCFRCGASIELSEEQEQEALRLLNEQEQSRRADSQAAVAAISPTVLRKPKPHPVDKPSKQPWRETEPQPRPEVESIPPLAWPRRVAASQAHRGARAHVRKLYEHGGAAVLLRNLLRDLPAWLVSLVLHLVAMLLLGLWCEGIPDDSESITLYTSVSYEDIEGERGEVEEQPDAFEFEDPGAIEMKSVAADRGAPREEWVDLEPVEVPLEVDDPVGALPSSVVRPPTMTLPAPLGHMFAGRDPEVRAQTVFRSGGTSFTEAAVARGLKFLARHQNADGRWSLHGFDKSPDCDKTCQGRGHVQSDIAGTALALLPFLGAGQTHQDGRYSGEVLRGLNWLVSQQKENGDLRDRGQMYAHGQATIALCEAYALTGDSQLRGPAQKALNFIRQAQHNRGGWRYEPRQAGDTSVVGWQVMAIKSGQMASLHVLPETFEMAGVFLDDVQTDKLGAGYGYQPGHRRTDAMTAEALLCRQYLGWPKDHPGLEAGADFLLEKHLPDARKPNVYYWYYATQVMHHLGGSRWDKWNTKMRRVLVDSQQKKGHGAGSWTPRGRGNEGGHADRGGRIYMTALSICILEVYYRHMPIYSESVWEGFE